MRLPGPFRLLPVLLVSLLLMGCGLFMRGPARLEGAILTDQIDPVTKAAQRDLKAFPAGTRTLYVTSRVTVPRANTKVEAHWYYDRTGDGRFLLVDSAAITFDAATRERNVAFSLSDDQPLPAGSYKVVLSLDGKRITEVEFQVQ